MKQLTKISILILLFMSIFYSPDIIAQVSAQDKEIAKYVKAVMDFSEKGDTPEFRKSGAYYMGLIYEKGLGVNADTVKAMEFYMMAADEGKSKLKDLAYKQIQILQNIINIKNLATEISDNDINKLSGEELKAIALDYEFHKDVETAKKYLRLAVEKGNGFSANHLGLLHYKEEEEIDKQNEGKTLGLSWWRCVEKGTVRQSVVWFKRGAELEYAPAMANLAKVLFNGYGVFPDIEAADKYGMQYMNIKQKENSQQFEENEYIGNKAPVWTASTSTKTLLTMGKRFSNGVPFYALYYLEIARTQGSKEAIRRIGGLYLYDTQLKDYKKAFKYLKEAIPDEWAYYYLGELYENGWGVDINMDKAIEYYRQSAEQENSTAQKKLNELTGKQHLN
ncbi:MAG: hypothetical protein LBH19_09265 [Dysgonamonadaceae bacterium]|jgi:TPR repeat protein|nr:hypothetical protein [Dysgonamonadaceae bacterium]